MVAFSSPALFLSALFFLFAQLLTVVYLDDALHGASLRTLFAALCINGSSSVALYFALGFFSAPAWQTYLGAMFFITDIHYFFWYWWLEKPHGARIIAVLIGIAALLALGAYYGLKEYANFVKH